MTTQETPRLLALLRDAGVDAILIGGVAAMFALDPAHAAIPSRASAMVGWRNLYLTTTLGRLDLLGETPIGGFDTLTAPAVVMQLAGGPFRVASLDDLIAVKSALGRPKDGLVEVELRALRERLRST